jgi:uncharacterized protein YaaR (DUF327 family)
MQMETLRSQAQKIENEERRLRNKRLIDMLEDMAKQGNGLVERRTPSNAKAAERPRLPSEWNRH